MNVIFRADASTMIGTGHIMRCLVVADALRRQNYSSSFACIPQRGDMISYIEERGYEVIKLAANADSPKASETDYSTWLLQSEEDDAKNFVSCVGSANIVVVDHYAIGKNWQREVGLHLNCTLVAIDDLVRDHHVHLIIDQTLGRRPQEYSGKAEVLAGIDYAMIAPKFSHLRVLAVDKEFNHIRPKVLISMGGVDQINATLKALQALVGKVDARFTVLLGTRSPHFHTVRTWCDQQENVEHKEFESDMASLMLEHDIAIGAPGTTSWERACLGLPSIIVPLADNQLDISKALVDMGLSVKVEIEDIASDLLNAFETISRNWITLHQNNLLACDGEGVTRVVSKIIEIENENNHSLQ